LYLSMLLLVMCRLPWKSAAFQQQEGDTERRMGDGKSKEERGKDGKRVQKIGKIM